MFDREFKDSFYRLGELLLNWVDHPGSESLLDNAIALSKENNLLFTPFMQRHSIATISRTFLAKEELERWSRNYNVTHGTEIGDNSNSFRGENIPDKNTVGVIMAGNIPLVGFHDFLCVAASGRNGVIKLSSKDKFLLPAIFEMLCGIEPKWRGRIEFTHNIEEYINTYPDKIGALISTGSNSTGEAVAKIFAGLPMLLRGRRFSFAVLSGKETKEELEGLAYDAFLYFGLGCRNVNYLFVPQGYSFELLKISFASIKTLIEEECYMNVFKRTRAVSLMEGETFIDGGFFLLKKGGNIYPPIGELGYSEYASEEDILGFEQKNKGQIQKKYCTFGIAQAPLIDEYADGVDVIEFISKNTITR